MANIWIVNDYLTCVQGTKTFWHMLLEIEGAVDKTGTPFHLLADRIEKDTGPCDLIIRNGTFFGPINKEVPQIVLIQDRMDGDAKQIEVMNKATFVVFNSEYTAKAYENKIQAFKPSAIVPLGVNEDLFKPMGRTKVFKNDWPVGIFVGDYNETKNTAAFEDLARRRPYINFIYVSKQGHKINLPNIVNIPGGANEWQMAQLYNAADFCLMLSPVETLHLSSIEAGLCNKPVVGTNTGWLVDYWGDKAGIRLQSASSEDVVNGVDDLLSRLSDFSPREHLLSMPFTWSYCKRSWEELIKEVLNG